ncbi:Elongated TPR repeat-containing domain protein [Purpureocillium lavendulum]|uniref:Elongated TPR repeat-containing domain protein n=1 Tax=Purpureocillium lavendulum TaxID=1247861 RepID=A0AB34FX69_9HYPO|nr:Elongated TPR repeat-containing domain protein [Purpureocillium lavendulum]
MTEPICNRNNEEFAISAFQYEPADWDTLGLTPISDRPLPELLPAYDGDGDFSGFMSRYMVDNDLASLNQSIPLLQQHPRDSTLPLSNMYMSLPCVSVLWQKEASLTEAHRDPQSIMPDVVPKAEDATFGNQLPIYPTLDGRGPSCFEPSHILDEGPVRQQTDPPTSRTAGTDEACDLFSDSAGEGTATEERATMSSLMELTIKEQLRRFWSPEEYRVLKPRVEVAQMAEHEADLIRSCKRRQTRQWQGYFRTMSAANEARAHLRELYRKPPRECTSPATDDTFPSSDEAMVAVVKQVFDAIMDWSYILEWKSALDRHEKVKAMEKLSEAGEDEMFPGLEMRPSVVDLEKLLPSVPVQQQKILGQVPSDQTIELISWGVVERIDAISFAVKHSKQLVKSLLTAGDGWKLRIVNCPRKEFRAKGNNRRVNAAKEKQRQNLIDPRSRQEYSGPNAGAKMES